MLIQVPIQLWSFIDISSAIERNWLLSILNAGMKCSPEVNLNV